ncbi:hypothetical protein LINPERPRIM_LOCUS3778, partial [Linum perenne]
LGIRIESCVFLELGAGKSASLLPTVSPTPSSEFRWLVQAENTLCFWIALCFAGFVTFFRRRFKRAESLRRRCRRRADLGSSQSDLSPTGKLIS